MTRHDDQWPETWIAELIILGVANIKEISPLWVTSALASTIIAAALSRSATGAMESGDAKAIANAAHALKSPSSAIGAFRLGGLLQGIELAGKVGDIARARAAFANLDAETAAVLEQLRLQGNMAPAA